MAARKGICSVFVAVLLSALALAPACSGPDAPLPFEVDAGRGRPDARPAPDAESGPALRIDYLDPERGPYAGGTLALLRGRGFVQGMSVKVDGRSVEPLDVKIIDGRRATIVTPAGDPGPADVVVEAGDLVAEAVGAFTYDPVYIDPPLGSVAGGTFVRILGWSTTFETGDVVTLDGDELRDVTVVAPGEITGYTPPGTAGGADVEIVGAWGALRVDEAYTYTATSDPFQGGLGGGSITGAINVVVIDSMTGNGVPQAFVTVDDPIVTPFSGTTDDFGQITFSAAELSGTVTVTAAKEMYDRSSFVVFDARDITIFLTPIIPPSPGGGGGPGREAGIIVGAILFGDATGLGTPHWDLVPEPRRASERKLAMVFTTFRDPFSGNPDPGPGSVVEYVNDGRTSWDFSLTSRPAALAVWAVAGLYDSELDPDGVGPLPPGFFQPYALGVERGVLVGPGEVVENVAVVIDIPLDTAIDVDFIAPPPLGTPGYWGPTEYQMQAFIDLGGEGVISLPASQTTFPPGATSAVLPWLAPLVGNVGDATYTIFAGAYAWGGSNPFSVRVERGVRPGLPIPIDDFLGVPRPIDPAGNGLPATEMHLSYRSEGPTNGLPTFWAHYLDSGVDGSALWSIYARGDQLEIPLYDLVSSGAIPPIPATPNYVFWTTYSLTIPGLDFDDFTYRHLNANYWSAYAADAWAVQFPLNP